MKLHSQIRSRVTVAYPSLFAAMVQLQIELLNDGIFQYVLKHAHCGYENFDLHIC
jgi:hypothetical protein